MTGSWFEAGSRRLLISRIAIVVFALASLYYNVINQIPIIWAPTGDFGIKIDQGTAIVNDVAPRNTAKGIRLGDRVDLAAMPFRERSYLYDSFPPPVGLRMTLPIVHGDRTRTETIEAVKLADPLEDEIFAWGWEIVGMLFIMTGVVLVWDRPNVMLWGLAVFLISKHWYIVGPFISPAVAAVLIFGFIFMYSIGVPGLIVFACRFPYGRPDSFAAFWNVCAAGIFVIYACGEGTRDYIALLAARPINAWPDTGYIGPVVYIAIFVVLCTKLRKHYRSTSAGFKWIVAGYGVAIVIGWCGTGFFNGTSQFSYSMPAFAQIAQLLFMPLLPAAVAYSVIRHHSFGLGYLTNRTLVFALLFIGIGSTFLIGLWLASNRLSSTLGIGTAMFVALLVGMLFQAQHRRLIRFVDRVFLPHRYEAGVALDHIRETLRGTNDPKRVTSEVAEALGLASVAVFERTLDGGFVRNAASGWPCGTAWHLLPGEALTNSLDDGAAIITLPDELADYSADSAFSTAHARPLVALTIRRSGRVERAVFVGPYRDGARLDRDTIRSVHGIFDDALVV